MAVQLNLYKKSQNEPEALQAERLFEQSVVSMGRATDNDLVIPDFNRRVSGHHAAIEFKAGGYVLRDRNSKNGTYLNGTRLDADKDYPLTPGDRIEMEEFYVVVQPVPPEAVLTEKVVPPQKDEQELSMGVGGPQQAQSATGGAIVAEASYPAAQEGLEGAAMPAQEPASEPSAMHAAPVVLEAEPAATADEDETGTKDLPPFRLDVQLTGTETKPEAALLVLLALHQRLTGDSRIAERFSACEDIIGFGEHLAAVTEGLLTNLHGALEGRRQFEDEFDAQVTKILPRGVNPFQQSSENRVKYAKSREDLIRYVFGSKDDQERVRVIRELNESFKDVLLHQVGLLSGAQKSLEAFLDELSPEFLDREINEQDRFRWVGRILHRFSVFRKAAMMDRLIEKERSYREDHKRTFERVFGRSFSKGYVESIKHFRARKD